MREPRLVVMAGYAKILLRLREKYWLVRRMRIVTGAAAVRWRMHVLSGEDGRVALSGHAAFVGPGSLPFRFLNLAAHFGEPVQDEVESRLRPGVRVLGGDESFPVLRGSEEKDFVVLEEDLGIPGDELFTFRSGGRPGGLPPPLGRYGPLPLFS